MFEESRTRRKKDAVKLHVCDIYSGETRAKSFVFCSIFIILVVMKLAEHKKITKMKIQSQNKRKEGERRRDGFCV